MKIEIYEDWKLKEKEEMLLVRLRYGTDYIYLDVVNEKGFTRGIIVWIHSTGKVCISDARTLRNLGLFR